MKRLALLALLLVIFAFKAKAQAEMTTSAYGRKFIESFEGCRLKAYKCPAGVWTIGIGNTTKAKPGKIITYQIAQQYLQEDLKRFERHINANATRKLKWYEFDALTSFCFNVGYRFRGDLAMYVNNNLTEKVVSRLKLYVHAGSKTLAGLVRRRLAETELYKGNYE